MGNMVKIDWFPIETEFRAGQFSIREIAKKHDVSEGAIRRHAKLYGLTRDLSQRIKRSVLNKLARANAMPDVSDEEIIDTTAAQGMQIVLDHRDHIKKHRAIVQVLAGQLDEFAKDRDAIEKTIIEETKDDTDKKRRNQMFKAVSLPSHAGVARDLSSVLRNLIPLERQTYGLDEDGRRPDPVEEIIITVISPEVREE